MQHLGFKISTCFYCTVAIPVLSIIICHQIQLQEMQKRIRFLQEESHLPVPTDYYTSSDTGSISSRSSDWSSTSSALSSGYGSSGSSDWSSTSSALSSGYGSSRSSDWSSTSIGLSSGYSRIMPSLRESHSAIVLGESNTTSHHSSATSENTAAKQK